MSRSLVWNLRQPLLEAATLPDAISHAVASLREGREIAVHTDGESRRLPGAIEHELLRIAQEAVTNAVDVKKRVGRERPNTPQERLDPQAGIPRSRVYVLGFVRRVA